MTPEEEYSTERIRKLLTSKPDTWREEKGYWINASEWLLERLDEAETKVEQLERREEELLYAASEIHLLASHITSSTKFANKILAERTMHEATSYINHLPPDVMEKIKQDMMNEGKKP